jgi:hypothetical protein
VGRKDPKVVPRADHKVRPPDHKADRRADHRVARRVRPLGHKVAHRVDHRAARKAEPPLAAARPRVRWDCLRAVCPVRSQAARVVAQAVRLLAAATQGRWAARKRAELASRAAARRVKVVGAKWAVVRRAAPRVRAVRPAARVHRAMRVPH